MKIVVTIVGKDSVGIIAAVSTLLAENGVNILTRISWTAFSIWS